MTDLKPFKLDIDELINDFAEGGLTTLAEMKSLWLSKKFSFIFEAIPSTNQACFMQSLYAHSIGYMLSSKSLSHRLGGLYCVYCLHEIQPFKPPFKIYLSVGELKGLKNLLVDAKENYVNVASVLVKSMLERNMFLFGLVDINESSAEERLNELTDMQNARVRVAFKKLFANTQIEHFINMDLGKDLEVDLLKKKSMDYAGAKEQAIKGACALVDIQNIKHIAENKAVIGDAMTKIVEDWSAQKALFCQRTGYQANRSNSEFCVGDENFEQNQGQEGNENFEDQDDDDNFGLELEERLLCQLDGFDKD